jgi:hypothetical protein
MNFDRTTYVTTTPFVFGSEKRKYQILVSLDVVEAWNPSSMLWPLYLL